jgi:hypothetical protein
MGASHKKGWLFLGLALGLTLVLVPAGVTIARLARVSAVVGGLRQAVVTESKRGDVERTLSSASLTALTVPPGMLLTVLCALALRDPRRRRDRTARSAPEPPLDSAV